MRLRHLLHGVALTLSGAGVWLFFYLLKMCDGQKDLLATVLCTIMGVLMTSVYTVPLGVFLAFTLPPYCAKHTAIQSLGAGLAVGAAITGLTSVLVAYMFVLKLGSVFKSMSPICVGLIAAWAAYLWWDARRRSVMAAAQPAPSGPG